MVPDLAKRANADRISSEPSSSNPSIICSSMYNFDAEDVEIRHEIVRNIIKSEDESRWWSRGERCFFRVTFVGVP